MQPESSEEAHHFEQVLGRLDALLKRNPATEPVVAENAPVIPDVVADNNVPVLDDVYEGATADLQSSGKGLPTPLLTEPVENGEVVLGQPVMGITPDAQSVIPQSDVMPQPVTGPNYDVVLEETITELIPQLQAALDRIIGEEIERLMNQVRAAMAARLHDEFLGKVEETLRERLRERLKLDGN